MTRIIINLTSEKHKRIEKMAILEGKPIEEFMVEKTLSSSNNDEEPARFATMEEFLEAVSDETVQAIKDAEEGKNIIACNNIDELFDDPEESNA